MRFKLSTAAAAATVFVALAALNSPATAANVIYTEQALAPVSTYLDPTGGTNGFAVLTGNTYFINFTVPASDSLLNISTYVVSQLPGIGPVSNPLADTFSLFTGTATSCGGSVCGLGAAAITPILSLAGINAKIYNLPAASSAQSFVLEVTPNAGGALQGNIQLGVARVPEPAIWTMMIMGVGMIGLAARRRRNAVAFA